MSTQNERQKKIDGFVKELLNWNRRINLIGRSTEESVYKTHIEDSLSLYPYLIKESVEYIIDIGSGGGLPSIPLSIFIPEKHFILTEVDLKKIAFLEYVIRKLKLNAEVVNVNEGFCFEKECIVISRAYSSIKNILKWGNRHALLNKRFYILKGLEEKIEKEVAEAKVRNYGKIKLERGYIVIIEV